MPTIPPIETKIKLDTLSIRKKIKALKLLGNEEQLTPLTDTDIHVFKKLLNKSKRTDSQEETFNEAADKILHIFSLYDEVVGQFFSQGKFNRRQLKVLLEQSYWQKIVEAYEQEYGFDLNGLDPSDKSKISLIQKEHMQYAQKAILCLLDVKDFSNNANFNNSRRIASLAEFDDRYFKRHEVKQLLEKDQTLFTEVLNFYPTDHEISELKGKYSYVNHFFALVDYHRAWPKISEAFEIDALDYTQGPAQALSDELNSSFGRELSQSLQSPSNLGLEFPPDHQSLEKPTPTKRLDFSDASITPISRSNFSKDSSKSFEHINDISFSSFQGGRCPEEQEALEFQRANLHARALVLPNIVSPDRVSDRKKLVQLQRYFIEFLLSNSETSYLNIFILDACLLNDEIENCYLEENVDKNFAFDFLTKNRVLLLKMLNLSSESSDTEISTSILSKTISILSTNKMSSSKDDLRRQYNDTFSSEMIDPRRLEGLVTQLLAYELNHNEQVFSRMFSALSYFEPKISDENKKKWLNLLIEFALNKPEYATKLLDRRYCFKWFSQQAKAYLEIADIKRILLGSRQGENGHERYNEAQISLVFSRRFFFLVKPDAMKFSGEDLINLLVQGRSDSLERAIATKPYYLHKILHALNDLNINGDTAKITETLTHILQFYPSILDCLKKEYPEFSRKLNKEEIEVFHFPERIELSPNQQSHPATGTKVRRGTASSTPNQTSSRTPVLRSPHSISSSSAITPAKGVLEDVLEDDEKSPHQTDNDLLYPSARDSEFSEVDGQQSALEVIAAPSDEKVLSAIIPKTIADVAESSEQLHFIQSSSAPAAPPFSSPFDELRKSSDSSVLAKVIPEAMMAVAATFEQQHFTQGTSAPAAPPLSSPLTGLGNTSLFKEKEEASQPATASSSAAPKPAFLETISSARDAFFNKSKQQRAEIQTVLHGILSTTEIQLKKGLVEDDFITKLQTTNNRESAIALMQANLLMENKAGAQQNSQADADNSFDSLVSASASPSSPLKPIPISEDLCKVVMASFAKLPAFKNWACIEDLAAKTPAKPATATLSLAQLMSIRRQRMEPVEDKKTHSLS